MSNFGDNLKSSLSSFGKNLGAGITSFLGSGSGIGTIAGIGANILGNLLGNKSQSAANKANLQISQMNNEFNERMLEKTMRYNSAQEQVQRYKDAGLNPALMMQGQGAGQASAVTASPTPAMQAFRPDFSDIGSAIETGFAQYKQQQLLDEQIHGIRIENQYKRQRIVKELANMDEQRLSSAAKRKLDEITSQNLNNMQTAEYELNRSRKDDLNSQVEKRVKEMLLLDKEINNFDARWNAEKAESVARTLLLGAQRDFTYEQMRREVYNTIQSEYKARREELDFKTAERMADAIVEKAIQETVPAVGKYGQNTGDWFNQREYGKYPKR